MSRRAPIVVILAAAALPGVAQAQLSTASAHYGGGRAAADPEEHLARLAAAGSPQDIDRGRPSKHGGTILKDDPNLRAAFGFLDNK